MKRAVNTILQRNNRCQRHLSLVSLFMVVLTTLIFVSSCVIPLETGVEKREISPYIAKHSIRDMAVVDNGVVFSPFVKDDTLFISCCPEKLAERTAGYISNTKLFDEVLLLDSSLSVTDTAQLSKRRIISPLQVDEITSSLNVDNLLAVDAICAKIGLYTEDYSSGLIPVNISFTLYGRGKEHPLEHLEETRYLYYPTLHVEQLQLENDILALASELGASMVGERWVTASRVLYTSLMSELRYGYMAYRNGRYDEAERIWKQTAENSAYRKNRVAAYVNLALLSELRDNYRMSLFYLDCAEKAMGKKHFERISHFIEKYRRELNERICIFDEKT